MNSTPFCTSCLGPAVQILTREHHVINQIYGDASFRSTSELPLHMPVSLLLDALSSSDYMIGNREDKLKFAHHPLRFRGK